MCETFEIGSYSVVTSLNERNIYIKFTDNINFMYYECSTDSKELRLQFELSDIYSLIKKCFLFEDEFSVKINVSSNLMKLIFNAKVGGFLKINFEALLREKIMSNDNQLTMNLCKIENKYDILSKKFEKFIEMYEVKQKENELMMDYLSNADIVLCTSSYRDGLIISGHVHKINSTEIYIEQYPQGNFASFDFNKIQFLYRLEKLTFIFRETNLVNIKSKSIKEINIHCCNEPHFKSLEGFENLPNLETLSINDATAFTDIVSILKNIDHKIKNINLRNCNAVNKVELQTYCQNNNINLAIA